MRWSLIALIMVGCGDSGELAALKLSLANAQESIVDTQAKQIDKTDEAIGILKDNTTALAAIKANIEALQVVSNPNGKESDPASAAQSPPAKANTAQAPLKVATPGDFSESETLVELATRLYSRGVNVHNKTENELRAIDAQLSGGQAVSGAMFPNNGTSAVTSKRSAVRFVPRGSSFVQWQNNSTQQSCGPNGCPPRRSR
jgi:hypothetical protein